MLIRALIIVAALLTLLLAWNGLRHLVLWGETETVRVASGDVTIVCTFARPESAAPVPAVLELLGSGRESRFGPGYRINASNMLRHGFAVLVCDKRGHGDSTGDLESATFADFAADAGAAVRYLADRPDIRSSSVGLFTNSQSGWYAPQVAVESGLVAFIINRVGPPLSWLDTVRWETRNDFLADGARPEELADLMQIWERIWDFYIAAGLHPEPTQAGERAAIDAELTRLRKTLHNGQVLLPERLAPYDQELYRSLAVRATYDPAIYLRQLHIPLLYVFGGQDINVPTEDSVTFLRGFDSEYPGSIDVHVYPAVGHPMATWRGLFHGGYPPDYMRRVGRWARDQAGLSEES